MNTLWAILLVLIALTVGGCAFLSHVVKETDGQEAFAVAVAEVTKDNPTARAELQGMLDKGRQHVRTAQTVTVEDLYEGFREEMDWAALHPAEQFVATRLLETARERLQERYGTGPLARERRVDLLDVLDWIEEALHDDDAPVPRNTDGERQAGA